MCCPICLIRQKRDGITAIGHIKSIKTFKTFTNFTQNYLFIYLFIPTRLNQEDVLLKAFCDFIPIMTTIVPRSSFGIYK